MKYNIYPIPHEVRGLEYLNLLHKHVEEGVLGEASFCMRRFSWRLLFARRMPDERHIIHIHWETNIYGSKYVFVSIARMLYRFPGLWFLKLRGIKIVWTIHNLSAHDYPHPKIDALGRGLVWRLADTVIMQTKNFALGEAKRHPAVRVVYIPQGNYVDIYGPLWEGDREALRRQNGVSPNEVLLLALGSVRPYKALPELIQAVTEAYRLGAHLKLLIRGKASAEYAEEMGKATKGNPAVDLRIGFVKDEEIPAAFAMADYSVFYYGGSSLNSAAMILSLSYGTPVITRDIPAAEIVKPGKNGFVFHEARELCDILMRLDTVPVLDRRSIIQTVAGQTWPFVASELRKTYTELWTKK